MTEARYVRVSESHRFGLESEPDWTPSRSRIAHDYRADEAACVRALQETITLDAAAADRIHRRACGLVESMRARRHSTGGIEAFLHEYDLASDEGVILMCLAEALLRIPDATTADRLIRDKLARGHWDSHLGHSSSLFVNAGTWGLMLTGRMVAIGSDRDNSATRVLQRLVARGGEPLVRAALRQAMGIMARQFVMGRTIAEAIDRGGESDNHMWRYSFDMLGEAAVCHADVEYYQQAYRTAVEALARQGAGLGDGDAAPGISVKLSALHPRYAFAKRARLDDELVSRVLDLARRARQAGIALTLDAEEAERLEPSLDVFARLRADADLAGWDGLGVAVQAYQKRAPAVIDWFAEQADRHATRIPLRLVKGAYWDTEIKRAQELGLDGYPVYTRKVHTDVAYLACARRLLDYGAAFLPQFATHNAYTVAWILEQAGTADYEFQRLHGMGEALYQDLMDSRAIPGCRVYAPVGGHEALLPYLVRRLLENGANSSFVNRAVEDNLPVEEVVVDPLQATRKSAGQPHPRIPLPRDLYGEERPNSHGPDLSDPLVVAELGVELAEHAAQPVESAADIPGENERRAITDPSDHSRVVGYVRDADAGALEAALATVTRAVPDWNARGGAARAALLRAVAARLEAGRAGLMALIIGEGGRTLPDALAEVREAVDFCRYYAVQAEQHFAGSLALPGPTGESNELALQGRGVFACISPWNFPLAIFTGQVAAALAAGNAVVAKPAEQTPLTAARAVGLFRAAGIPEAVLQLLPGDGAVGESLVNDPRIDGVAFTGSIETARAINRALAGRDGPVIPLIAETGGVNAMIADSSALAEQVVRDVTRSAFNSAGQRCSALRVLFVQEEIAPRLLELLAGAMRELTIRDPALLATDVGPVIDASARQMLEQHAARMRTEARVIQELALPEHPGAGHFFAPCAYEIERLDQLPGEVFGPILHVIRYRAEQLDAVIDAINNSGYGLTLGIHSRVEETAEYIRNRARVGNIYVNRDMIGSVVGVQPFGGEKLSGTGFKAGGPHYLLRFAVERTFTVNTAAIGGNASLYTIDED